MASATIAGNRMKHAFQTWMRGIFFRAAGALSSAAGAPSRAQASPRVAGAQAVPAGAKESSEEPVVFAVSNCYPTRILLYAAAFQGGWKAKFLNSLRDVVEEVRNSRPKAVIYDHTTGEKNWDQFCSTLAADGVPFILLGHKNCDETFLVLLAHGGYHACGNPLNSEEIVKAVDFAEEIALLAHAPVK